MKLKYIKQITFYGLFILAVANTFAQNNIGIGTIAPDPNAILEVKSENKGLLIPRVSLSDVHSPSPLNGFVAGMIVYNTATFGSITPGYYGCDGSSWTRLSDEIGKWSFSGNANTNPPSDFIGTTDALDVFIKRNGQWAGMISENRTSLGLNALPPSRTGLYNNALGINSLNFTGGGSNTAIGENAQGFNFLGSFNTSLGHSALKNSASGSFNTAIGFQAGFTTSGSGNVFLGHNAGYFETGSNKLYIHNNDANSAEALIYGDFSTDKLQINNKLGLGTLPTASLDIRAKSSTNELLKMHTTSNVEMWYNNLRADGSLNFGQGSLSDNFVLGPGGKVGIGRAPATHALEIKALGTGNNLIDFRSFSNQTYWQLKMATDGTLQIHTTDNTALPNGLDIIKFKPNGYLGVNIEDPSADLHIKQSDDFFAFFLGTGDEPNFYGLALSTTNYDVNINGYNYRTANFLVDSGNDLDVNIQGYTMSFFTDTGGYSSISDRRLKENISPIKNIMHDIRKLNPTVYNYKHNTKNNRLSHGFIAQEVANVFPQFVDNGTAESMKTLSYNNFNVVAVQGIKEQEARINTISSKINESDKNLSAQVKLLNKLELLANKQPKNK